MFGFHFVFVENPILLFPVLAKIIVDKGVESVRFIYGLP